jgi:hypothetical protein
MTKYILITPETLNKQLKCFSNDEEISTYVSQMDDPIQELLFLVLLRKRVPDEERGNVIMRQVSLFSVFCREHADLLYQLISQLDAKGYTKEEMNKMKENEGF